MKKLALLLLLLGTLSIGHAVTTNSEHARAADQPAAPEHIAQRPQSTEPAWRTSSIPDSLAGTDPDGDLSIPVSRGTLRLFDYYLTTLGETDVAGVRALVTIAADRQGNTTEVLALFDRYIEYLEDLRDTHAPTIERYFARAQTLQARYFGADAETLFGEENRAFLNASRDQGGEN